jgi:uridine kinase
VLHEVVEAIRNTTPPAGVATTIVAVDGPGGAGKSTVAAALSDALGGAPVVHTDDFASWENPLDWWPDLIDRVLEPRARGQPARFTPNTWGGPAKPDVVVEPGGVVIVEGVTASRDAFRPYLAYAVWVETPRELRLQRGLERDGEAMREQWLAWMADEDTHIAAENPAGKADAIVPGLSPTPRSA